MGSPPRRHGSGSIERLPSGSYRARTPDRLRSRVFAHERDAHLWLDRERARSLLSPDVLGLRDALRLRDVMNEHLDDLKRRNCTQEHIRGRRSHLGVVVARWGDLLLDRIDGPVLEQLVEEMTDLGWSAATVSNRLEAVTGSLRLAMRRGWIAPRTLPVSRPRRILASRPTRLTDEETTALLAEARRRGPWHLGVVTLALSAGLRRGELYRFRREDVQGDPPSVVVPVRDAVDRPKSGRERWVPIAREAATVVLEAAGDRPFAVPGGPIEMDRRARPMFEAAGLGGVRWHRLRHTWASNYADAGATLYELMEAGGWTSPALVRRYYRGPSSQRRGPAERAAAVLRAHELPTDGDGSEET